MAIPTSGPSNPTWAQSSAVSDNLLRKVEEEAMYTKHFSKSILNTKIEEFNAGKYTKRYIQTYLDFTHLEGIIDNLQYLEFKSKLEAGEYADAI
jgi:hypothetical protein